MDKKYRVDLHTHSIISHDGGITASQYERILTHDKFLTLAITDHNEIELAQELREKFRERIIVGEEIMTLEGEVIGLFLEKLIPPFLSLDETIQRIKAQNALVYIPHPLETVRKGLSRESLNRIKNSIDIVEIFNARTMTPRLYKEVEKFADDCHLAKSSASDAHCSLGLGSAETLVDAAVDRENLLALLKSAEWKKVPAPKLSFLCPGFNRFKKQFV